MLAARLGAAPALRRAGADKVALFVGEAAKDGNHQTPDAGGGVGPRLGQERNCPPASTMRLTVANKSKVERARRSIRVTVTRCGTGVAGVWRQRRDRPPFNFICWPFCLQKPSPLL